MEIVHRKGEENGFFFAKEDGKNMGYLSYEWATPTVFAIMHTVVEEAFQGKGVGQGAPECRRLLCQGERIQDTPHLSLR